MDAPDVAREYERAGALYRSRQFPAALKIYKSLAETPYATDQLVTHIGLMYGAGAGTDKDPEMAAEYLRRAPHYPPAQYALSAIHALRGNLQDARRFLEQAAAQEYAPALYHMGRMYETGTWVTRDDSLAYRYFEAAAARGHVWAERQLAWRLMSGRLGVALIPMGFFRFIRALYIALRLHMANPSDERLIG